MNREVKIKHNLFIKQVKLINKIGEWQEHNYTQLKTYIIFESCYYKLINVR